MKKLAIPALLLLVGLFAFGALANAATCEMKTVCVDNTHVGLQGPDCKIIPAAEVFDAFPGAKGASTHVCNIGCKDGECINDNLPEVCSDSDGGTDYFVKGTVTLKMDGATGTGVDYCSDNNTLQERSCGKSFDGQTAIGMDEYKCINGCISGACVKTTSGGTGSKCTDTDGGKDIYKSGIVAINGLNIVNRDRCGISDPQYIDEYFCLPDGTYSSEKLKCAGLCERGTFEDGDTCSKTCAKTDGYYCNHDAEGSLGTAYLDKNCVWSKYAPCQSRSCGLDSCLSFGAQIDTDGDGLLDSNEKIWGTDPNKMDTDGDGYNDMTEIFAGFDPLTSGKLTAQQLALLPAMEAALDAVDFLGSDGSTSTNEELSSSSATTSGEVENLVSGINDYSDINTNGGLGSLLPFLTTVLPIILVLVVLLIYIYTSLCFQFIAKKLNVARAWMAWVPIANYFLLVKCADKSYWWVLLLFVPVANIVAIVLVYLEILKKLGYSPWLVILMFITPINLILFGFLAFSPDKSQNSYPDGYQSPAPDVFPPQVGA